MNLLSLRTALKGTQIGVITVLEVQGNDIVRCKDCKHYKNGEEVKYNGCASWIGISECEEWSHDRVDPDGWCYKGEKK